MYKDKFLVLFLISETAIEDSLRSIIPSSFLPSKLIYLDRVPLTSNGWLFINCTGMSIHHCPGYWKFSGKIDRAHLIATLEEKCSMQMKSWASILAFLNKFGINSVAGLRSHSFADYGVQTFYVTVLYTFKFDLVSGIRSLEAAEIALHLGNIEALHDILDPTVAVLDVLKKYNSHLLKTVREFELLKFSHPANVATNPSLSHLMKYIKFYIS